MDLLRISNIFMSFIGSGRVSEAKDLMLDNFIKRAKNVMPQEQIHREKTSPAIIFNYVVLHQRGARLQCAFNL